MSPGAKPKPAQQAAIVAQIMITLDARGNIHVAANCPGGRPMVNMLLETAKQNLVAQILEQEKVAIRLATPAEVPPPPAAQPSGS
jgi:hypothetical protein